MTSPCWNAFLTRLAGQGMVCLTLLLTAILSPSVVAEAAGTRVRIIDTWPEGNHVNLGRDQTFYVRLAYESETPVRIWARPYHEGEPAHAGSHASPRYSGRGEALGWFFLMEPGTRVDEIQVTAGDGSSAGTALMAVWRGQIFASSKPAQTGAPPQWVEELRRQEKAAHDREVREAMAQPVPPGEAILAAVFMWGVLAVGLVGLVWPWWALMRWRGKWLLGAALPALLMTLVVLRLVIGIAVDPGSHNLWPFELLIGGLVSSVVMVVLVVARRLTARMAKAP